MFSCFKNLNFTLVLQHKKHNYSSLLFVRLPYAEDLRDIELPLLSKVARGLPSAGAVSAMKDMITAMDLMT